MIQYEKDILTKLIVAARPFLAGDKRSDIPEARKLRRAVRKAEDLLITAEWTCREATWTKEWPTEPGTYWFRGFSGRSEDRTAMVEVRHTQSGLVYITDGHFLYKDEGAEGYFMPAELPVPPAGANLNLNVQKER